MGGVRAADRRCPVTGQRVRTVLVLVGGLAGWAAISVLVPPAGDALAWWALLSGVGLSCWIGFKEWRIRREQASRGHGQPEPVWTFECCHRSIPLAMFSDHVAICHPGVTRLTCSCRRSVLVADFEAHRHLWHDPRRPVGVEDTAAWRAAS